MNNNSNVIEITPTWEATTPIMIDIIKNPDASFKSIENATNELLKMARVADKYIEISSYKDGECVEQYVDLKDSK
jgi:hypothetical protein